MEKTNLVNEIVVVIAARGLLSLYSFSIGLTSGGHSDNHQQ